MGSGRIALRLWYALGEGHQVGEFVSAGRITAKLRLSVAPDGFTLVELLVVITIIAALIAILMPALAMARGAAQATVCASGERQLALGDITYAQDHDARYVLGDSADNLEWWCGRRDHTDEPFDPSRGPLWPYLHVKKIILCPAFAQYSHEAGPAAAFAAGAGGYGYNNAFVGTQRGGDWQSTVGARVSDFRSPTQTLMFADAAMARSLGGGLHYIESAAATPPLLLSPGFPPYPASPSIHFRHDNTANIVWLDGHVSRRRMSFARANTFYGASEAQNKRMRIGFFGPNDDRFFDYE